VITDFTVHGDDFIAGIALLPDRRIIASGSVFYDFGVSRYLSDGSLDPSFGRGVKAIIIFGNFEYTQSMALQSGGKIVMEGTTGSAGANSDLAIARFNSDGTLDAVFGTGGKMKADCSL
jgi:uncharacterized delta-60 repeat protein